MAQGYLVERFYGLAGDKDYDYESPLLFTYLPTPIIQVEFALVNRGQGRAIRLSTSRNGEPHPRQPEVVLNDSHNAGWEAYATPDAGQDELPLIRLWIKDTPRDAVRFAQALQALHYPFFPVELLRQALGMLPKDRQPFACE